jgi:hypothetical protein
MNNFFRVLKSSSAGVFSLRNYLTAQDKKARNTIKKFSKKSQIPSVLITGQMTVSELASQLKKPPNHVFKCLSQLGLSIPNQRPSYLLTDWHVIVKIIQMSGFRYTMGGPTEVNYDILIAEAEEKDDSIQKRANMRTKSLKLVKRPPVVCIMGHVIYILSKTCVDKE